MGCHQSKGVTPTQTDTNRNRINTKTLPSTTLSTNVATRVSVIEDRSQKERKFVEPKPKQPDLHISDATPNTIVSDTASRTVLGSHQPNIHLPGSVESESHLYEQNGRKHISNHYHSTLGLDTTVSHASDRKAVSSDISTSNQFQYTKLQDERSLSVHDRTGTHDQGNFNMVHGSGNQKTSMNQIMSTSYKTVEKNIDSLQRQIQELRFERDKMAEVNRELTEQKSRLKSLLDKSELELGEMRTRLSRIASNSLTDNNPNIADLSDQNRPTKLADRFQELYCNEWSGAYEDLTQTWNKPEKQAVQILLDLIKNIYTICLETSERQENDLKSQIMVYTGNPEFSSELSQAMRPFKDKRKKMFQNFLPGILQEIKKRGWDSGKNGTLEHSKKIQRYIDLSAELCWLMCIQDPKVHLYTECREGAAFDEANFSAYTVRGTMVDFLVWPSLHLHKGGALLKKGVAQGKGGGQTRR